MVRAERDLHSSATPSLPRESWWLCCGDKLQEQGSARCHPAEPASCLFPAAPGPPDPRGMNSPGHRDSRVTGGASPRTSAQCQQDHSGCKGMGPHSTVLFLKKNPQKASVLPVTCRCHTRPFQINPREHKAFFGCRDSMWADISLQTPTGHSAGILQGTWHGTSGPFTQSRRCCPQCHLQGVPHLPSSARGARAAQGHG